MPTKSEIYTDVRNYLNRQDETGLSTTLLDTWFRIAHRALQRPHLFKTNEAEFVITLDTESVNSYPLPDDWRQSNPSAVARLRDENGDLKFYNQVNFGTLQERRVNTNPLAQDQAYVLDGYDTYLWAEYMGNAEVWPNVSGAMLGKEIVIPYFKWTTADGQDWFTENAGDYIMYRMLMDSVPVLGQPETRMPMWQALAQNAYNGVFAQDTSRSTSGSLKMKGG